MPKDPLTTMEFLQSRRNAGPGKSNDKTLMRFSTVSTETSATIAVFKEKRKPFISWQDGRLTMLTDCLAVMQKIVPVFYRNKPRNSNSSISEEWQIKPRVKPSSPSQQFRVLAQLTGRELLQRHFVGKSKYTSQISINILTKCPILPSVWNLKQDWPIFTIFEMNAVTVSKLYLTCRCISFLRKSETLVDSLFLGMPLSTYNI